MNESDLPFVRFRAHDIILRQGDTGTPAYLVAEGEVSLIRCSQGQSHEVARLGRGEFFGEFEEDKPMATTAKAVVNCTLLRLDQSLLAAVMRQRPEVGLALLSQLSRRWREALDSTAIGNSVPEESAPMVLALPPLRLLHALSGEALKIDGDAKLLVGRMGPNRAAPDFDLGSYKGGSTVSRQHATIERCEDRLWLCELPRVTNGTFVNGRQIVAGEKVEIHVGDEVRFGEVTTVVACD